MKPLTFLFVLFILSISCEKEDVVVEKNPLLKCSVSEASTPPVLKGDYFGGFKKEYYPDGKVKTLRTRRNLFSSSLSVDSMRYELRYDSNLIHVTAVYEFFMGTINPDGPDLDLEPVTNSWYFPFEIVLDEKTGNALSAGNATFQYEGNRLVSVVSSGKKTVLEYDSKGNITKVPGARYEYDAEKTAEQQLYFFGADEMFSLVEMLGLIPITSHNLRIKYTALSYYGDSDIESPLGSARILNHKLNEDGLLISYDVDNGTEPKTVYNSWQCSQ